MTKNLTQPHGRTLTLVHDTLGTHASYALKTQLPKAQLVEDSVLVLGERRQLDEQVGSGERATDQELDPVVSEVSLAEGC